MIFTLCNSGSHKVFITAGKSVPCSNTGSVFIKRFTFNSFIFSSTVSVEDGAIALMKVYKMGPKERQKRGLAGREWVLSDESGFTAKRMGQGFIDNIDKLFEEWTPQPRFTVTKVDDSTKLSNYNPNPISLTKEFIKEIQSI